MNLSRVEPHGLTSQSTSGTAALRRDPKLERSAHEFEANLITELLKPLQQGDGFTGEDSDSGAGSEGALSGFASESLARAISERGGFGIADRILRQLESTNARAQMEQKNSPSQIGLKLSRSRPI